MRIEATPLQLDIKVRGDPKQKGELIQFVSKGTKRAKRAKHTELVESTQHNSKKYAGNY